MPYEPLHHKYRPQTFGELVGQGAIAQTLTHALESDRIAPAYLFTGPRGTGKTSSARILAKSLNCLTAGKPTATPCGHCQTCTEITRGIAMDIIEIDAASNTGVDNIREIIERAQFAPVQCRYKVYAIDECLTGDTLVLTEQGLFRIDNPEIQNQRVLSYNEKSERWEYQKVVRWLEQGVKDTITIKTRNTSISCTGNHLIRTDQGWKPARNVLPGTKILSPAPAVVANSLPLTDLTIAPADSCVDTNFMEIGLAQELITSVKFLRRQNHVVPTANVSVEKSWRFPLFCNVKAKDLKVSNPTGQNIPTKKDMAFGNRGLKILEPSLDLWMQNYSALSTVHCWGMEVLTTPMSIAGFHDCDGLMAKTKKTGSSTKLKDWKFSIPSYALLKIKDMEIGQFVVKPSATQISFPCSTLLNQIIKENKLPLIGYLESPQKDWHGGIWMMALSPLVLREVHQSNSIQKDFHQQKTTSFLSGLLTWDTPVLTDSINGNQRVKHTTIPSWEPMPAGNLSQICDNIALSQWHTNFEIVESVTSGETVPVYDLEVEHNHNFVAHGLLVHNCHMLSVAAFNALLKTLEEPPPRVVFILATTDPQRVLNTIISRCQRFDFRRIPLDAMVGHLGEIAKIEGIAIAPDALTLVAQIANGGLRDAESLLDQLSLNDGEIRSENVWDLVGAVPEKDLLALIQAIRSGDPEAIISQCRHLLDRGREPLILLQNLTTFYLNLLIAKTAPQRSDLIAVTAPTWEALKAEAQSWQTATILQSQQALKTSEIQIKQSTQPRLWLEVALLGLLPAALAPAIPPTSQPQPNPPKPEPTRTPPQTFTVAQPPPSQTQTSPPLPTSHSPLPTPPDPNTIVQQRIQAIWQRVVDRIQPPSTQMLVRQQCTLMDCDLDEGWAQIGVPSQGLFKMAETKLPQIAAAFQQILDAPITLELKVHAGTQTPPRSTTTNPSPPPKHPANLHPPSTPSQTPNPPPTENPSPFPTSYFPLSTPHSPPSSPRRGTGAGPRCPHPIPRRLRTGSTRPTISQSL